MHEDWYVIKPPRIFNSGYEKEYFDSIATNGFEELLNTFLGDEVELCNSDFSVRDKTNVVIQGVSDNSENKNFQRQILAPIGTLSKYSYVIFNGIIWIISTEPSSNKIYEKSILKLCNNKLRWLDDLGNIREYPYYIEDATKYGSGIAPSNIMTTLEQQYIITLPYDVNTKKFNYGNRFILGETGNGTPIVYSISKYDPITLNFSHIKLLKLIVIQDEYDQYKDNKELMIADYYRLNNTSPLPKINCHIDYLGLPVVKCGGSAKRFSAKFYDVDGKEIPDVVPLWSISDTFNNQISLEIDSKNNTALVKVLPNTKLIGEQFSISVTDQTSQFSDSLIVEVVGL